jgi:vitamin B12 transporter
VFVSFAEKDLNGGMRLNNKHTLYFISALVSTHLSFVQVAFPAEEATAEEATAEDKVVSLEPYVIVATRTPLGMERVSPSVDYISSEDMNIYQAQSLTDVLDKVPGIVLIESGGIGAQASLFTRGTESNHTAVFMDGRRLSAGFGNQYDLEFLSVNNLSSVQMQRGASSVNYGSSGIGGVIDLRTKTALDAPESGGSIEAEFGSNKYRRGVFSATIVNGDFGLSTEASKLTTDNERPSDAYRLESVSARADYRLSDAWSLELLGKYTDADKELPGTEITPKVDDRQNTQNWLISPGLRYATDELSMHLFYSRSNTQTTLNQIRASFDDFWNYRGDHPISNVIKVESDELSLQLDYSFNDDLLLTTGMVYRSDDASNSNLEFDPLNPVIPYSKEFNQVGGFVQALWMISDFELRGGLRYDDYSEFDSEQTWSTEAVYYINNIDAAVFAKYATSYAPPGAADIAFDLPKYNTPLDAERSVSYELGFKQTLFDGDLQWSLIAFRNEIEDLLGFDAIQVAPFTFEYDSINVKSARTDGIEFAAEYRLTAESYLSVGYTYLTAVDEDTEMRLLRRPRHILQLGADYDFTRSFSAGAQLIGYFDREDFDPVTFLQTDAKDFVVARLVANWKINQSWSVLARVENLLDKRYSPAAGYPALGRAGYIGARYEF